MTGTLNKTIIIGRLGADPDIRMTKGGKEIARFNLATNERFTDKAGEKQEHTEWHRALIFTEGLITKVVKPYLKKGSKLLIEGANRTNKYTDKDGVERYSTDIVVREITLLDRKPDSNEK